MDKNKSNLEDIMDLFKDKKNESTEIEKIKFNLDLIWTGMETQRKALNKIKKELKSVIPEYSKLLEVHSKINDFLESTEKWKSAKVLTESQEIWLLKVAKNAVNYLWAAQQIATAALEGSFKSEQEMIDEMNGALNKAEKLIRFVSDCYGGWVLGSKRCVDNEKDLDTTLANIDLRIAKLIGNKERTDKKKDDGISFTFNGEPLEVLDIVKFVIDNIIDKK